MLPRFRFGALRTLEQSRHSSVACRFTIPPRMETHAEDRRLREALSCNALFVCFRCTFHLNHPDERLALLIAHQSRPFFVQGNEMNLEVGGVGNDANDDARKHPVHGSVVHGVRMMSM